MGDSAFFLGGEWGNSQRRKVGQCGEFPIISPLFGENDMYAHQVERRGDEATWTDRRPHVRHEPALVAHYDQPALVPYHGGVPGFGDLCGLALPLHPCAPFCWSPHTFRIANYSSPLHDPDRTWFEGQISSEGTQIYLLTIRFEDR